jgi:hypothetical protein
LNIYLYEILFQIILLTQLQCRVKITPVEVLNIKQPVRTQAVKICQWAKWRCGGQQGQQGETCAGLVDLRDEDARQLVPEWLYKRFPWQLYEDIRELFKIYAAILFLGKQ